MRRWWAFSLVLLACSSGGAAGGSSPVFDPDGDDSTGMPGGDGADGADGADGTDASSGATSAADGDPSGASSDPGTTDGGSGSDSGSSGGVELTCPELGYVGTCVGDTLWWCEGDMLHMKDCALEGEVCEFQDDTIGYNCLPIPGAFGYPVGDRVTAPAGGWYVTQVLGHYLNSGSFVGGHLAQDIAAGSEAETAGATVYSVGPGTVLYAGSNTSSYVNVVLIEHDLGGGETVCSFYGHLGSVSVAEGEVVGQGDPIATVLDWNAQFGGANSHLHYVMLSAELCAASDAANGALICGYDNTAGPNGIEDLDDEPYSYTSVGDPCGTQNYPDAFISPSQFIATHQ